MRCELSLVPGRPQHLLRLGDVTGLDGRRPPRLAENMRLDAAQARHQLADLAAGRIVAGH